MNKTLIFLISFILLTVLLPSLLSLCGGKNSQNTVNTQAVILRLLHSVRNDVHVRNVIARWLLSEVEINEAIRKIVIICVLQK